MVIPYLLEDWQREADMVTMDEHNVVKTVGNYILKQTLGKGSMGKVKLGVHIVTGEKVAIKIVPRATRNRKLTPKELSRELRAIREGHLMMLLNHPHIVYLRDMVAGSHHYYFMMDYVNGGQLLHYIVKRSYLTEQHARHFCRQMVSALDYMHRNSVVHRDLKIENILVDKSGHNIKIIDFGLSNLFCPERQLTTYCGSLYFAAPELLNGHPYRGPEIDVWSLGVVLYVMVTGSVPFDDKSLPGLHEKIKRAQVAYPAHISNQCHQLLSNIFVTDSQQRITLADIIRHPWINYGYSNNVYNHLPFREPLNLPLDENILKRMTYGFNLGTLDDIRMKMEVILQSPVYRVSATHVSDIQSLSLKNQTNNTNHSFASTTSLFIKSRNRLTGKKSGKRVTNSKESGHMIWGTYNDPQTVPAAYHPLLSLYYLTRERMERIEGISIPRKTSTTETVSSPLPPISKSALSSLDNTIDSIPPKHLTSSQQSNHHYWRQSCAKYQLSALLDKNPYDNLSKRPGYVKNHHSDYFSHHHGEAPPMIPPTPSGKSDSRTKPHNHNHGRYHSAASASLTDTSFELSAPSSSPSLRSSSFLSTTTKLWSPSSCPQPSSTTLPLQQNLEIINHISHNNVKTKPTLPPWNPFSAINPGTANRKPLLFLKLGAFFKQTSKKQSKGLQKRKKAHYHHQHRKTHHPYCDTISPTTPCCSHYHDVVTSTTSTTTRPPKGSDTVLSNAGQQQLVPPAPIHQQNTHHKTLPINSTSSGSTEALQVNQQFSMDNRNQQDTSITSNIEDHDDTPCRHEGTPSWLSRRLSTWMDHALLLNRSN